MKRIERINRTCPICSKIFLVYGTHNPVTCSVECGGIYRRKKKTKTCPVCGKEFSCYPKQAAKFCSVKCRGESKRVPNDTRECISCGKKFEVRHCSPKRYCSIGCIQRGNFAEKAAHWNGGIRTHKGYILRYTPEHPYGIKMGNTKYVKEHRLVMEKHIGRYLKKHEVVHHINGKKTDNRIENLRLFKCHSDHMKQELHRRKGKNRT